MRELLVLCTRDTWAVLVPVSTSAVLVLFSGVLFVLNETAL